MLLCLLKTLKCQNLINIKDLIKHYLLFIIYADIKRTKEKIYGCKNNPENSSTTKVSEYIPTFFQYLQDPHLETQKIGMIVQRQRLHENVSSIFRRARNVDTKF